MTDAPQIVRTTPQLAALIRLTVPREHIREVMGPGLAELRAAVAAQGVEVTGPWFTHHLQRPADVFDFEICLPVAAPVSPVGRVRGAELPAATVARTVYQGSYDGLGVAWGELMAWIETSGHLPCADLFEAYLSGPEASPDPAAWRTELSQPLIDR